MNAPRRAAWPATLDLLERSDVPARFLRSTLAATLAQAWRFGVVLATHLALRRLVGPGDWGLWHWSESVFLILGTVRDLGLTVHTLRARERPFGTLLRVEAAAGAALALLAWLAAPLLARAYGGGADGDEVVAVLRALTAFLVLEGIALVPQFYFQAELRLGRALPAEAARHLGYAAAAVGLALRGYGVWSFVLAQVASVGVYAAVLWAQAARRMPLARAPQGAVALLRESWPIFLGSLLVILTLYVDRLILGARFAGEVLGRYGFAFFLSVLPMGLLLQALGRSVYPTLLAYRDDPARQLEVYRLATVFFLALETPAALFLLVNAEALLVLLGGPAYGEAAPFLRLLCLAPLADPFGRFGGVFLVARGQERSLNLALLATVSSFAGLGILLTGWLGPVGMAWANLAPLGTLVLGAAVRRASPAALRGLLRDLAFVYLAPLPAFALAACLPPGSAERLALSAAAAAVALLAYRARFGASFAAFFRRPPGEQRTA